MLAITLLLAGCSGWSNASGQAGQPATTAPTSAESGGPPFAHLEAANGGVEMAQGSSCWSWTDASGRGAGRCIDAISWSARHDIPRLVVARKATITLRLGFAPTEPIYVEFAGHHFRLPAHWRSALSLRGHGLLTVFARGTHGDASYAARV
jgi:hypothetical protein